MIVTVGEIKKSYGQFKEFHFKSAMDLDYVDLADDLDLGFRITNAGSRLLVEGTIKTSIFLKCARCLEKYEQPLNVKVQEQFLPIGSPELDPDILDWETVSLFPYEDDKINLEEVVRQNIIAAIPIKPLCSKECSGIDYPGKEEVEVEENSGDEEEAIDPRLMPLLNLKKRLKENDNN